MDIILVELNIIDSFTVIYSFRDLGNGQILLLCDCQALSSLHFPLPTLNMCFVFSYVAVAAIEVPAYIALPLIIDVWGRYILGHKGV